MFTMKVNQGFAGIDQKARTAGGGFAALEQKASRSLKAIGSQAARVGASLAALVGVGAGAGAVGMGVKLAADAEQAQSRLKSCWGQVKKLLDCWPICGSMPMRHLSRCPRFETRPGRYSRFKLAWRTLSRLSKFWVTFPLACKFLSAN